MQILPADKKHPPRPDVPVLSHITFTEIHAIELGTYFGLLLVWSFVLDIQFIGFILAVSMSRKVLSRRKMNRDDHDCDHDIGFHDVIQEPPYFGWGILLVVGAYLLADLLVL